MTEDSSAKSYGYGSGNGGRDEVAAWNCDPDGPPRADGTSKMTGRSGSGSADSVGAAGAGD